MFGLYLIRFSHDIILEATVTDDASIVDCWLKNNETDAINRLNVIGLDVKIGREEVSTIQLCLRTKCLVIRLSNEFPASLRSFLSNPKNTFVGINVQESVVSALKREFDVRCNEIVFDVRELAERRFPLSFGAPRMIGLKTLTSRLLNIEPERTFANKLEDNYKEQVKRVCFDAYVLHRIGVKLLMEWVHSFSL